MAPGAVMKWMGIAGAFSLALMTASHANEVVIPGSFAVSESGAATYSIDIDVPPGTAGIEPKLSLTYSSQGGNGLFGMGWSLSGLSSITRCPKTVAQDGVRGAVKFDANDRFCLDGQRLIATSGTYGASGTEYRTEMEGFSRITSTGTSGTGPTSFTVETKSGLTMIYGGTEDSRIEAHGTGEPGIWAINRVEDTLGNFMTVTYTEDGPSTGAFRPFRIDYTGNGSAAPHASVRFLYDGRLDVPLSYQDGVLFAQPKRLKQVQTFVGETFISTVKFEHVYEPETNRTRLADIEKCHATGCLPKTVFSYTPANGYGYAVIDNAALQDGIFIGHIPQIGDFNGDGLADVFWSQREQDLRVSSNTTTDRWIWTSNGDGTFSVQNAIESQYGTYKHYLPYLADFNGDGYTDFLWAAADVHGRTTGVRNIWLNQQNGTFSLVANPAGQNGAFIGYVPVSGDFNGDGRSDILWDKQDIYGRSQGTRYIWFSNGDGTFWIQNNVVGQNGAFVGYGSLIADFNGDGNADILWDQQDIYGRSQGTRYIWFSNGDGSFWIQNNIAGQNGAFSGYRSQAADFNGDGKPDLFWDMQDPQGRSTGTRYIWYSRGDGTFGIESNIAGQNGAFAQYSSQIGDFNGDGHADIFWDQQDLYGRSSGTRYIWRGKGEFNVSAIEANVAGQNGTLAAHRPVLGDFDGDSKTDVLWVLGDTFGRSTTERDLWLSNGSLPNLLTSVDDGFGAKVQLSYKPLTDGSVYTKGTGATYPEIDLQVPSYVVSRAEVRDGIGGFVPTEYRYGGLKARADGRGSLGFAWTEAEQVETDFVTRREYRQDYPYVGRIALERTSAPSVGLAGVLSEKTYSFACLNPANGLGCVEAAGNRYFPYASSIVEKGWDLDGSVLPTVTTTNAYDSWGNATQIDVVTSDGFSKSTTNTYTNDAVNWILGRLTRTEVTDVSP